MCVCSVRLLNISHVFVTDLRRLRGRHIWNYYCADFLRWFVALVCHSFIHRGIAMILVVVCAELVGQWLGMPSALCYGRYKWRMVMLFHADGAVVIDVCVCM